MTKQKSHTTTPTPSEPDASAANADKGDYTVGYGRPPVDSQFKKGVSANPRGRAAGRPNTKTTVARIINEMVPVREGDKTRNMTKLEAMMQAHLMKAMKGDARSATILIGLLTRMGLLADPGDERSVALSDADDAILADYMRRHTGTTECYSAADSGKQ